MADDSSSLSQEEIDALLNMDDDSGGGGGGGGDDLNLDGLLGGGGDEDSGGGASQGLDQDALNALAGAVAGPASRGGGGGGGSSAGMMPSGRGEGGGGRDNVDLLLEVTLRFTVELGRTQMYIRDVLMLGESSVVELDKNVGDEVDILINDRLFGRGRLVVLGEYFGVQITHIIDPLSRFRNL
ncbi:MAG: flagellar motor switch protein FliN [Spirochaetales bacterium]|nr:flagellar motor switch protein FliN [Leptospiraceae bacterium]MCP5481879.1 flagellar motor switch protein FliN [Spirochaetales bacterium]MCP5486314.1 flagellar motor switch protein FliN [Spirochaetales bacterium]